DCSDEDVLGLNRGAIGRGTTYEPGRIGQAFAFDNEGEQVVVTNSLSLQLQTLTIECWIRRKSTNLATLSAYANGTFFAYGSGGYAFGMFNDGRLLLTKVDVSYVASTGAVVDTNWHHVVVSKSGTNVSFYVDSVAAGSTNYLATFSFASDVAIGAVGGNR